MSIMSIATPPVAGKEGVERVIAALGGEPEGLQARFIIGSEGGVKVVAVWESLEHLERFSKEKLGPALAQVMGEPTGTPDFESYEVLASYVATPAVAG
jgi:hypothetical protein